MRKLLFIFSILGIMSLSLDAQARELGPVMKEMGAAFKVSFKAARSGDNSPANQETVKKLSELIVLAKNILPKGIDPTDSETVQKYQDLMEELLEKSILLEDSFATNPMDKDVALTVLKEMNSIRKKGHAIFR
ncbi:MAG: hypothetical protein KC493_06300 [Bacteriovoracaceae bacterium]|nr:hypothetical protein [Bacteriovoracaceae bacterium]